MLGASLAFTVGRWVLCDTRLNVTLVCTLSGPAGAGSLRFPKSFSEARRPVAGCAGLAGNYSVRPAGGKVIGRGMLIQEASKIYAFELVRDLTSNIMKPRPKRG